MQTLRDIQDHLKILDPTLTNSKAKRLASKIWKTQKLSTLEMKPDPYRFRGPRIHDSIRMHRDPTGELAVSRVLSS